MPENNTNTNTNTDTDTNATVVKFTKAPKYETVAILGKTIESTTMAGTFDREPIVRKYLTEAEGFSGTDEIIVSGADRYGILTVKADETDVAVELMGGKKSAATWKFKGYSSESLENPGCTDFFVPVCGGNQSKADGLRHCAYAMCEATPEAANLWQVVDAAGKRVFIRFFAPIDKSGRVRGE